MSRPGDTAADAARDPRTSAEELARIAATRPDLLPAIHANPSTYPDLRAWIETYYPEAVRRGSGAAGLGVQRLGGPGLASASPGPAGVVAARGRGPLWVLWLGIGVVLVAVTIVLFQIGVLGGPRATGGSGEPAPSATPAAGDDSSTAAPAQTAAPVPSETPTPTPTPTETETLAGYLLMDSATMNFSCEIHPEWVGCSIAKRYYDENGQADCDEDLFSLSTASGVAEVVCGQKFLGTHGDHVTHLVPGQKVSRGDFSCRLQGSGAAESVECRRTSTGQFFEFNRNAYTISW